MIFATTILLIVISLSIYLNGALNYLSFEKNTGFNIQNRDENISAIRFLTSDLVRVRKNYETPPRQLGTSLYNITSEINGNVVALHYQFPLLYSEKSILLLNLEPQSVSSMVDKYGVLSSYITKESNGIKFNFPSEPIALSKIKSEFKVGAWILDEASNLDIDYLQLVDDSLEFAKPISAHILAELTRLNFDGYFERVQAVLNFVQFIPYGQPDFDFQNFFFLGLALPSESLVLNYSDCDSKSILFAAVLSNLINRSNIILVICEVSEGKSSPEQHMMVGIKGLPVKDGKEIEYKSENYNLIETTTPCEIGSWHWESISISHILSFEK